ncbi:phage tail protein [Streptomyces sp. INA 01156]
MQPIFTTLGPAVVGLVNALGPALAQIAPSLATVGAALADGLAILGLLSAPWGLLSGWFWLPGSVAADRRVSRERGRSGLGSCPSGCGGRPRAGDQCARWRPLPVLPQIGQAFGLLVGALTPFAQLLGTALAGALQQLLPPILALVPQLLTGLLPAFQQIVGALAPLIPLVIQFAVQAIAPLLPMLAPVVGMIVQLVGRFAEWIVVLAPVVAGIMQVALAIQQWSALNIVIPILSGIISGLQTFIGVVMSVSSVTLGIVNAIVEGFRWLYNTLVGNSIIPDLVNGIAAWFRRLPGMAASALGSLVSAILGPIRNAASSALSAARTFVSDVVTEVRALPGKARAALSGAKDALVSAGRDLIQGMINGVREMAGNIASAAREVVSNAVSSAKSALGISSPSKVFAQIGRDTGRGFIEGLTGTVAQIKATAEKVAKSITKAFEGKKTKLDDRLVAMIDSGNRRLQKLAKQRESLAKRIDEAIEFANRTYDSTIGAFSLQNLTQGEGPVSTKMIAADLEDALKRVKKFNADIAKLAKLGLRKDLLRDIIGMGPERAPKWPACWPRRPGTP